MKSLATITSKRQLTIPADIFNKAGLATGDKVLIEEKGGELTIKSAQSLVEELAGSVEIPERLKSKNLDKVIESAKKEYFSDKE